MLRLARGTVLTAGDPDSAEQELTVQLADGAHPAIVDTALLGHAEPGDEVLVNIAARELELGSGGFDIVHANLTRGLDAPATSPERVMKLNYTSLQHAVHAVEADLPAKLPPLPPAPVAVLALHSQLAPLAWAFANAAPGARLGYIQTVGGALPASHSHTARLLRERGLLAGHLTAGAAFGGPDGDAITTPGALAYAFSSLRWDAAVAGPGPGIQGSSSTLGHGGLAALETAHGAIALGLRPLIVPRISDADERPRHRGVSHHTATVLRLLLARVTVALPPGKYDIAGHTPARAPTDLDGYERSGLPADFMGRSLRVETSFFTASLVAGGVLATLL
ncbi:MAG: DUF3866 family protein [Solirubrobacteraceae bacterium]